MFTLPISLILTNEVPRGLLRERRKQVFNPPCSGGEWLSEVKEILEF